jgi:hypothetical protein
MTSFKVVPVPARMRLAENLVQQLCAGLQHFANKNGVYHQKLSDDCFETLWSFRKHI